MDQANGCMHPETRDEQLDAIRATATLEEFPRFDPSGEYVNLAQLGPGSIVKVHTRHSCYRVAVIDGVRRLATVQGGTLLREPVVARLNGATNGGSMLKAGWIGVGLCLEIGLGFRRIITSPVLAIDVEAAQSAA
jgi:hypothetical protein